MLIRILKNVIIDIKNRGGTLDFFISFFRDFLSGPLYIVVVVISVIGIFACIGYIAEATMKQKEEQKKLEEMYAKVHLIPADSETGSHISSGVETVISSAQLNQVGAASATNMAQAATSFDSQKVITTTDHSKADSEQ